MFFLESFCGDLYPIIKIVKLFINIIHFGVPIVLILFITIDFVKAVFSNSEDVMKKVQGTVIRRLIYAVAIFLVFSLVSFVMNLISNAEVNDLSGGSLDTKSWMACWSCTSKDECKARDGDSVIRKNKYENDYKYSNSKISGWDCRGGADDPDNWFKDPDTGNYYKYYCEKRD